MVNENKIRSIHEHKGKQRNARNRSLRKKKTQINENRSIRTENLRRPASNFYTTNVWQDLNWQYGGRYNIKCCSVPCEIQRKRWNGGKQRERKTYEDENEIQQ